MVYQTMAGNVNTLLPAYPKNKIPFTRLVPYMFETTPSQRTLAKALAAARKFAHDQVGRKAHQNFGQAQNAWRELWGCLGEIVASRLFESLNVPFSHWQPFAVIAPKGADFLLAGRLRLDIKAIPPGKEFLCVNEAELQRHEFDAILPIEFDDEETAFIHRPVYRKEILTWQLRTDAHSPYRSVSLRSLGSLLERDLQQGGRL